jgi:hypothetical protein
MTLPIRNFFLLSAVSMTFLSACATSSTSKADQLRLGMTVAEVGAIMGSATAAQANYGNQPTQECRIYSYSYKPVALGPATFDRHEKVVFDNGKVIEFGDSSSRGSC